MYEFWKKAAAYFKKKESEAFVQKYGCDAKCPHCSAWQSTCGGAREWEQFVPDDMHDTMTCGNCGMESIWFMGSMLPVWAEGQSS